LFSEFSFLLYTENNFFLKRMVRMKKLFAAMTVAAILTSLMLTRSMYVEQLEIPIIIIGTALLALMLKFPEDRKEKMLAHGMRIFAAFAIGWLFSTLDLLLDHLFFYQPT